MAITYAKCLTYPVALTYGNSLSYLGSHLRKSRKTAGAHLRKIVGRFTANGVRGSQLRSKMGLARPTTKVLSGPVKRRTAQSVLLKRESRTVCDPDCGPWAVNCCSKRSGRMTHKQETMFGFVQVVSESVHWLRSSCRPLFRRTSNFATFPQSPLPQFCSGGAVTLGPARGSHTYLLFLYQI